MLLSYDECKYNTRKVLGPAIWWSKDRHDETIVIYAQVLVLVASSYVFYYKDLPDRMQDTIGKLKGLD